MLERVLEKVNVTKEDLIEEYLSIREKIRNHEVGVNCLAPLLEKVAKEFRSTFKFESNTESFSFTFWYSTSETRCTVQNDSIDFRSSTSRWYNLVITPVDAQIVERMRTNVSMEARDYWDVCTVCGSIAWITPVDAGICNTCQQK